MGRPIFYHSGGIQPMASFLLNSDFIENPAIAMMEIPEQLLWIKLLCLASEDETRGTISLSDQQIMWKLRVSCQLWESSLQAFVEKGLIIRGSANSDPLVIHNWKKYEIPDPIPGEILEVGWSEAPSVSLPSFPDQTFRR